MPGSCIKGIESADLVIDTLVPEWLEVRLDETDGGEAYDKVDKVRMNYK